MLGISRNLFAVLLVNIATLAFFATGIIENRVNKKEKSFWRLNRQNLIVLVSSLLLTIGAFIFKDKKEELLKMVSDERFVQQANIDLICVDELSCQLLSGDPQLQFFDFRSEEEFTKLTFPGTQRFEQNYLFEKEPTLTLRLKNRINIFAADDELTAHRMALLAMQMGFKRIRVLQGGFKAFSKMILNFRTEQEETSALNEFTTRFRLQVSQELPQIMKKGTTGTSLKKMKRALGGC